MRSVVTLALFCQFSSGKRARPRRSAPPVYCPCLFHTICTDELGDKLDICPNGHHENACPTNHPLYGNTTSHVYEEDVNGTWQEVADPKAVGFGFHCRIWLAVQKRPDGIKYLKKVMGPIEYEYHNQTSIGADDPCNDECKPGDDSCGSYTYPKFFTFSKYEMDKLKDGTKEYIEHGVNYCCPKKSVYERYKNESRILDANGQITDAYRREFEKCHNPNFVNFGADVLKRAIDSGIVPWYRRPNFWLVTCLSTLFVLLFCAVQKLCRRKISVNRHEFMERTRREPLEMPEYDETAEFLLGEGGGGKVYECRDESGIERAIKIVDSYKDTKIAKSLRKECLIQHSFNHTYILRIMSPNIDNIPVRDMAYSDDSVRIERIVVEKYGWQMGKRNLKDLIHEIHLRGSITKDWQQCHINDIAWDIVRSLIKGIETLHTAQGCDLSNAGYGKYIKSVVHRDIKMKNIGVKKDSDGAFYSVLADFGLSGVCLTDDGRARVKTINSTSNTIRRYLEKRLAGLPKLLQSIRFLIYIRGPDVNDEMLKILLEEEESQTTSFLKKRWCGTEQWAAPEIMVDRKSPHYFCLDKDYHCRQCLDIISPVFEPPVPRARQKVCGRCTDEIFKFYRKNDIYGIGLVLWSILKAVLGNHTGYYTDDESDVHSYLECPLDATTSNHTDRDNTDLAETTNLLLAEISKPSRKAAIDGLNDPRISMIRHLAQKCIHPNPYQRPTATDLYQKVEDLEKKYPRRPGPPPEGPTDKPGVRNMTPGTTGYYTRSTPLTITSLPNTATTHHNSTLTTLLTSDEHH